MTVDSDDEHSIDGLHLHNVEDDDELDAIDLSKATEDDLDNKLGNPNDAEERAATTSNTHTNIAEVHLSLALSKVAEAQKSNDFCQMFLATIVQKSKSLFIEGEYGVLGRHHSSIPEL